MPGDDGSHATTADTGSNDPKRLANRPGRRCRLPGMTARRDFRQRIVRPACDLVIAPLALDALSAALAKRVGFDAIYLGGGGLGYQRGVSEALLTSSELAEATRAITERVEIQVVVDGSVEFGDAVHMDRTIR